MLGLWADQVLKNRLIVLMANISQSDMYIVVYGLDLVITVRNKARSYRRIEMKTV